MATQRQSNDIVGINSINMLLWSVAFTVVGLALLTTGFGYFFTSMAIILASIVVAKNVDGPRTAFSAWLLIGINLIGSFGYLAYILTTTPNYM